MRPYFVKTVCPLNPWQCHVPYHSNERIMTAARSRCCDRSKPGESKNKCSRKPCSGVITTTAWSPEETTLHPIKSRQNCVQSIGGVQRQRLSISTTRQLRVDLCARHCFFTWQQHDRGGVTLLGIALVRTPLIFSVSYMVMRNIVAAIVVILRSPLQRPKFVRVGELACHRATPPVPRR